MTDRATDHTPLPPPNRDPEVARAARLGISVPAILAAALACVLGIVLTRQLSTLRLDQDFGRLMVDAASRLLSPLPKGLMTFVGELAIVAYDGLRRLTGEQVFADLLVRILVALAFLVVFAVVGEAFGMLRAWFGDAGRSPETPDQIVSPRESGGGARLGGNAVLAATVAVMVLVTYLPALVDGIGAGTRWRHSGVGFVEAGLLAAGVVIATDAWMADGRLWSALWEWWARFFARRRRHAAPEPTPVPSLDAYRSAIDERLATAVRARPTIVLPARPTVLREAPVLGPATRAHAEKLAKALDRSELARWHDAVHRFVADGDGRNIVILDPLSRMHYAFLVEAMSHVQERGRGVLVLTPQATAETHFADLSDAFSIHCRDITQSFWVDVGDGGGSPKDGTTIETILLATDRTLQRRIVERDAEVFAGVVERLGLIVLLDAHLFDLTRLRLQLAILFQRAPATDIRVVAQAAAWRGMESELDRIFAATGRRGVRLPTTRATEARLEALVIENSTRARDALIDGFYRALPADSGTSSGRPYVAPASRKELEPLPILARLALRPPFGFHVGDLALIDADRRDSGRRWLQAGTRLEAAEAAEAAKAARVSPPRGERAAAKERPAAEERAASSDLEDLYVRRVSHPDPDARARLLLVQDRTNLIDVLGTLAAASTTGVRLALVACEAYPLRDYMAARVADGHFDPAQDHDTTPIAPRPAVGLRELARLLLAEMAAGDGLPTADGRRLRGVTRSRAVELFAALGNRRLAIAHRLSPTRLGIKRLLEMEFGGHFEVRAEPLQTSIAPPLRLGVHLPIDDDVVFVCANAEERSASSSSLIPVVGNVLAGGNRLSWLEGDDHGLAFVRGSTIVVDEVPYVVRGIADRRIVVEITNDPASGDSGLGSMPRTTFCRWYDLDLTAPTVVVSSAETIGHGGGGTTIRQFRLFAPMRRLTHAQIVEETVAPYGEAVVQPKDLSADDRVGRAHPVGRAVVLRFERPAVAPVDDAARAEDEITISRIAFTLQATLADILFSLFPRVAHRLAVTAPRAAPAFARLDADAAAPARRVGAHYPRLRPLDPAFAPVDDAEHADRLTRDLTRLLERSWRGEERASTGVVDAIDVIVLEDWPGDLGVCEALATARGQIQRVWRDYLDWSAAEEPRADLFHRFGSGRLVEEFVFAAARDLLPPTS